MKGRALLVGLHGGALRDHLIIPTKVVLYRNLVTAPLKGLVAGSTISHRPPRPGLLCMFQALIRNPQQALPPSVLRCLLLLPSLDA